MTRSPEPLAGALREMEATMPRFARWMYDTVKAGLGQRVVDAGAGLKSAQALVENVVEVSRLHRLYLLG